MGKVMDIHLLALVHAYLSICLIVYLYLNSLQFYVVVCSLYIYISRFISVEFVYAASTDFWLYALMQLAHVHT